MKNVFKLGFVALAIATSLSACDLFSSRPKSQSVDSLHTDTAKVDTLKTDTSVIDTGKLKAN